MKKFIAGTLAAVAIVAATGGVAGAAVTLIDGSTAGYYNASLGDLYNVGNPGFLFPGPNCSTGDPNLPPNTPEPTAFGPNIGSWLGNFAPTGGGWSSAPVAIPSSWKVSDETAVVYALDAGSTGLSGVTFYLGVDNGLFMWIDGIYKLGALAPGGSSLGEYRVDVPFLSAGMHYVQFLREDHGVATGFEILAKGDRCPAPVPEPGTMAMLGGGLLALVGMSRARTRK